MCNPFKSEPKPKTVLFSQGRYRDLRLTPFTFPAAGKQQTTLFSYTFSYTVLLLPDLLQTFSSSSLAFTGTSLSLSLLSLTLSLNHTLTTLRHFLLLLSSQHVVVYYNKEISFVWKQGCRRQENTARKKTKQNRGVGKSFIRAQPVDCGWSYFLKPIRRLLLVLDQSARYLMN